MPLHLDMNHPAARDKMVQMVFKASNDYKLFMKPLHLDISSPMMPCVTLRSSPGFWGPNQRPLHPWFWGWKRQTLPGPHSWYTTPSMSTLVLHVLIPMVHQVPTCLALTWYNLSFDFYQHHLHHYLHVLFLIITPCVSHPWFILWPLGPSVEAFLFSPKHLTWPSLLASTTLMHSTPTRRLG